MPELVNCGGFLLIYYYYSIEARVYEEIKHYEMFNM